MNEKLTAGYRPAPVEGAHPRDRLRPAVAPAEAVRGVTWGRKAASEGSSVTVCFTPRNPGLELSPVAGYLHFSLLSDPEVSAPPSVVLVLHEGRLELTAFGDFLWSTDVLDSATMNVLGDEAIVLIMDRPANFELSRFPRLSPSMIWSGRLPVQRDGP